MIAEMLQRLWGKPPIDVVEPCGAWFSRLDMAKPFDVDRVRATLTHPLIYPHISDDGSPEQEDFHPTEHPAIWYMAAWDQETYLGLFMFCPSNSVTWEVHTCLLPRAWGKSVEIAKSMAQYMFENTQCRRIITSVPAQNRLALRLAERVGFTRYGVNERSWLKDGQLQDQIVLGLSKPTEEGPCQQRSQSQP